ncbi:HAD hydrolase-like protein [Pedobacter sp. AW31-3R]|uniref:HAD hydrolase-like protein n=1 Tax=Pedobacter sp. AW31-3R TaxID=3445781 RepID=UPI003F9EBD56
MGIKLVVFDIAGTTVKDNFEVSKTFQAALDKHGYQMALDVINPLMGYEKKLAIRKLLALDGVEEAEITPALVDSIHAEFVRKMIEFYETNEDVVPLPHVEETFLKLRGQGIAVAINTGFSRDIADVIMERLQWKQKGLVDHVIGSDEVELGRPHPFMIQRLMDYSGITDAQEVAKVGDTEVDVREGQNAGCKYVIGVTTGIFSREELNFHQPTHIIDDVSELLDIIKS